MHRTNGWLDERGSSHFDLAARALRVMKQINVILESRIDWLTLQRQNAEHAFMDLAKVRAGQIALSLASPKQTLRPQTYGLPLPSVFD